MPTPEPPVHTSGPPSADPVPPRILIVDDEPVVLEALTATLDGQGYQVTSAADARTALRRTQDQEFALVLTDQRMPHLSGLELLARVQQVQPDAARVLMTGVLDLSTAIDCVNKGELYRLIVKPWLREELLGTVRNGVQRHALIRHSAEVQRTTQAVNESLQRQVTRQAEQNRELADLNRTLEHSLQCSVGLFLRMIETFHPRLGAQACRVNELCRRVATCLNLPAAERQILESSAWLYDVGLLRVPRRLITVWQNSPEALSPEDVATVQSHPVLGQEIAVSVSCDLAAVGEVIRAHHERFDGSGYPDGLTASQIPWFARLLAVAQCLAECELDGSDGREAICLGSGTAFDPEAVRAFLRPGAAAAPRVPVTEAPTAEFSRCVETMGGLYTARGTLLASLTKA